MANDKTVIQVSTELRDDLFRLKEPGDTYQDVVERLMEEANKVPA